MSEAKIKIYSQAVGRRKLAIAFARLVSGSGQVIINGKPAKEYFGFNKAALTKLHLPFTSLAISKYNAVISARGGGLNGQLDAAALAIARALTKIKEDHKSPLRKLGLLTRDSRIRQRRMIGTGGKSRRKKQSPKR